MRFKAVLILLAFALSISCNKGENTNEYCEPLPSPPDLGWENHLEPLGIQMPCFNPNNGQEFLFVYGGTSGNVLYTYNLQTDSLKQIFKGAILYPPQWGANDWILLNLSDNNILRIKSNGDSLINITNNQGRYFNPRWNYSYSGIVAYQFDFNTILMNTNGLILDTFYNFPLNAAISFIDETHIIISSEQIGIYNSSTDQLKMIANCDFPSCSGGMLVNVNEFIWADKSGIYRSNWRSGQTIRLKSICNSILYLNPTINKSGTKVLWTKIISVPDNGKLHIYKKIVEMNPYGNDEKELLIPL